MGIVYSAYHYLVYCGPPVCEKTRLRVTLNKLNRTHAHLESLIDERDKSIVKHKENALRLVRERKISTARRILALSKISQAQVDKYNKMCLNIHTQIESIADGVTMKMVADSLVLGSDLSSSQLRGLDPDRLQRICDTVEEQMMDMDEASETLATTIYESTPVDEDELEQELLQLCSAPPAPPPVAHVHTHTPSSAKPTGKHSEERRKKKEPVLGF